MPAIRPPRRDLEGNFVRLFPLAPEHLTELFAAIGSPGVFAGGYGGGLAGLGSTVADFADWALDYFAWESGNVFGIRLVGGADDGVLVGTSTLGDFDEDKEHAHIGWTAYDPRVWATAVNPEAKLLMLAQAFDNGFGRVKLQADAINTRSRGAILRLGATFEGITRRDFRRADGTWRDTAVYSILIDEWPRVRAGLNDRLALIAGQPVERR